MIRHLAAPRTFEFAPGRIICPMFGTPAIWTMARGVLPILVDLVVIRSWCAVDLVVILSLFASQLACGTLVREAGPKDPEIIAGILGPVYQLPDFEFWTGYSTSCPTLAPASKFLSPDYQPQRASAFYRLYFPAQRIAYHALTYATPSPFYIR